MANLASLDIVEVWTALGGGPLRGKRGRAFWRDGDGLNVTMDRDNGRWYDFRDCVGGGILKLVEVARQCDQREAIRWLEIHCGLDPLRPVSTEEQRRWKEANAEGRQLIIWRDRMLNALRHRRDRSFRLYHQAVQWIIENSLESDLAAVVADLADMCEEEALEAERHIELLRAASWKDLVAIFREQTRRAA